MENLFNGIAPISGELVVKSLSENASLSLGGVFTLQKGSYTEEFYYNAMVCESSRLKGFIVIDDLDYEHNCNTSLGSLKIDNISKFRESLRESGLSSLASTLCFSGEEIRNACTQSIAQSKLVKKAFKGLVLLDALSSEEQKLVEIAHIVENYNDASDYEKKQLLDVRDEEGNQIVPTQVELVELYQHKKQNLA